MSGKEPASGSQQPGQQQQQQPKKSEAPAGPSRKGPAQVPGGCLSWGCKVDATRFNFCPEHYEHFKFGLIKKTGEPVPDYEKKIEHYAAFQQKQKSRKVA